MSLIVSNALSAVRGSFPIAETCLVYAAAALHTSTTHYQVHKPSKRAPSRPSRSRTKLVDDLRTKVPNGGKLEVAPKAEALRSKRRRVRGPPLPARSPFTRDSVLPHAGRAPSDERLGKPLLRKSEVTIRRRPIFKGGSREDSSKSTPAISPALSLNHNSTLSLKHWAARAHEERTERRAKSRHNLQSQSLNPVENEFRSSKLEPIDELPDEFASPPLIPGILTCLQEILPTGAKPTPIQALSLKHLFKPKDTLNKWKEYLLASETGSGKSIAYMMPMFQDLKQTEDSYSTPQNGRHINPRALILSPTHELSRQLSSFAKSLLHISKLRVLCASRANTPSVSRKSSTASKMRGNFASSFVMAEAENGQLEVKQGGRVGPRPVDLLVGTPNRLLEMARGRGWNWEEREREKITLEAERLKKPLDPNMSVKTFWTDPPEMGLAGIEWVVVDEADVLLDPDFQEATRTLLSDIALARGVSINSEIYPAPSTPAAYPFNLILATATIPSSLASYLDEYHPGITRLASPNLHHLPKSLRTEYLDWSGGNRNTDIESRIRRVWAEDSLRGRDGQLGILSKVLVFCNKRSKVEDLSEFLEERDIRTVALTGTARSRQRGNNRHLDGFLRVKAKAFSLPSPSSDSVGKSKAITTQRTGDFKDPKKMPHVLITTSLLSRGLDFSPDIKHVFIVDEPRNMIDFLHRAGRTGRAGQKGKVVVFSKMVGRGSGLAKDVRKKIRILKA